MKLKNTKQVEYFGIKLLIPDGYSFIAVDKEGWLYAYAEKPEVSENLELWDSYACSNFIGNVDLEDLDWKETLREV